MNRPIGIFDSGVGGISVLREARTSLPHEDFIYYGDNAHAPYGAKSETEIEARALEVADILAARDVKALVIACNTATSAAAPALRARFDMPVIGMEPALKPAHALKKDGIVLVLATTATLHLPKFVALYARYGEDAYALPCPGLMEFVERGVTAGEELDGYLRGLVRDYIGQKIDCVVLGCTHYVFLREAVRGVFPDAHILDGNEGTARQLKRRLAEENLLRKGGGGRVELHTSGDARRYIPLMERLLKDQGEGLC